MKRSSQINTFRKPQTRTSALLVSLCFIFVLTPTAWSSDGSISKETVKKGITHKLGDGWQDKIVKTDDQRDQVRGILIELATEQGVSSRIADQALEELGNFATKSENSKSLNGDAKKVYDEMTKEAVSTFKENPKNLDTDTTISLVTSLRNTESPEAGADILALAGITDMAVIPYVHGVIQDFAIRKGAEWKKFAAQALAQVEGIKSTDARVKHFVSGTVAALGGETKTITEDLSEHAGRTPDSVELVEIKADEVGSMFANAEFPTGKLILRPEDAQVGEEELASVSKKEFVENQAGYSDKWALWLAFLFAISVMVLAWFAKILAANTTQPTDRK